MGDRKGKGEAMGCLESTCGGRVSCIERNEKKKVYGIG